MDEINKLKAAIVTLQEVIAVLESAQPSEPVTAEATPVETDVQSASAPEESAQ